MLQDVRCYGCDEDEDATMVINVMVRLVATGMLMVMKHEDRPRWQVLVVLLRAP